MTTEPRRAARHYAQIADAIEYLQHNFQQQPSLQQVAAHVHMSPSHFQRVFSQWAGTSPKKFLQYLSLEYAKSLLKQQDLSVMQSSIETGLSSSSRLHDLFVQIEGMTPAEYKHGGLGLRIHYQFAETLFGAVIVASTAKGICFLSFEADPDSARQQLQQAFPQATLIEQADAIQQTALAIFNHAADPIAKIKLHLKGTAFQLKVWHSLLNIPQGQVSSYGHLAQSIGQPTASRAVGTAIGHNPVAFLIPCHRVIQATGQIGGYRWSMQRKKIMLAWEAVQRDAAESQWAQDATS